jgi:hypothetical protein
MRRNVQVTSDCFAGFFHMHLTGCEIYENKVSKKGTFLEQMNSVCTAFVFVTSIGFFRYNHITFMLVPNSAYPLLSRHLSYLVPGKLLEQQFSGLADFQPSGED